MLPTIYDNTSNLLNMRHITLISKGEIIQKSLVVAMGAIRYMILVSLFTMWLGEEQPTVALCVLIMHRHGLNELTHLSHDKIAALFTDDIFRCIFMNEKFFISITNSLKFVPDGPIDNKPRLV